MKTEKITARITEEVLGSPQEHVDETLKDVIKKLKEEKECECDEDCGDDCHCHDGKCHCGPHQH